MKTGTPEKRRREARTATHSLGCSLPLLLLTELREHCSQNLSAALPCFPAHRSKNSPLLELRAAGLPAWGGHKPNDIPATATAATRPSTRPRHLHGQAPGAGTVSPAVPRPGRLSWRCGTAATSCTDRELTGHVWRHPAWRYHGKWFIDVYREWIDQRQPDDRRSISHQIKDGNRPRKPFPAHISPAKDYCKIMFVWLVFLLFSIHLFQKTFHKFNRSWHFWQKESKTN